MPRGCCFARENRTRCAACNRLVATALRLGLARTNDSLSDVATRVEMRAHKMRSRTKGGSDATTQNEAW